MILTSRMKKRKNKLRKHLQNVKRDLVFASRKESSHSSETTR